jgi:hypothetical protein
MVLPAKPLSLFAFYKHMRKIYFASLVCLAIFGFSSCSTKINTAAPYKAITVIYGLMDVRDTAHYIRIEKAFLDNDKSSVSMAQVADSLYYPYLKVVLKKINPTTNNVLETDSLTRVDLNKEGYPKDSGLFNSSVNYAYKTKIVLDPTDIYWLVVTNPSNGQIDSAMILPISEDPGAFSIKAVDVAGIQSTGLTFSATTGNAQFSDVTGNIYDLGISYQGANVQPVQIMQGILRFNWIDSNQTNSATVAQSADMNLGTITLSDYHFGATNGYQFSVGNIDIYYFLKNNMGTAQNGHVRVFDKCDVIVYAGSPVLSNYNTANQIAGIGLTGSTIEPVYTNILSNQKNQAIGVFTTRAMRTGKVKISQITLDSLAQNPLLGNQHIDAFR